jgi:hypothetical protein
VGFLAEYWRVGKFGKILHFPVPIPRCFSPVPPVVFSSQDTSPLLKAAAFLAPPLLFRHLLFVIGNQYNSCSPAALPPAMGTAMAGSCSN